MSDKTSIEEILEAANNPKRKKLTKILKDLNELAEELAGFGDDFRADRVRAIKAEVEDLFKNK